MRSTPSAAFSARRSPASCWSSRSAPTGRCGSASRLTRSRPSLVALAARGVAEGSPEHRRLRLRVLGGGALGAAALVVALAAPHWSSRFIDLGPTIYGRAKMSPAERRGFLDHAGGRQLAFREGWNATVSVWEAAAGRTLKVNGNA